MRQTRANKISSEDRLDFLKAASYQDFLKLYFLKTGLSYAEVARRAGFSSRSYPRDVTEGRRRLTTKALPTLMKGLRLEEPLSRLLHLLYFAEFPEEHPEGLPLKAIADAVSKQRHRLAKFSGDPTRKKISLLKAKKQDPADFIGGLTDIIASLGTVDEGVTLEDIHKSTGLAKSAISRKLERLVSEDVVRYHADSRRYSPGCHHLDWTGEAGNSLAELIFQSSVERLDRAAKNQFSSKEAMFLNSAVSVSKSDLPKLKAELREIILKFVDRTVEEGNGSETVIQIVAGMFEGRLAKAHQQTE